MTFVQADIADRDAVARVFAVHRPDRGAQPGGGDARRSVDRRSPSVHRHQHRRHLRAARGGAGVRRRASTRRRARRSGSCTCRPTRSTARWARAACSARRRRTRRTRRTRRARRRRIISCARSFHTYGLPVLITNCSNNYGPLQFPEKLIPLMLLNALEGRPLPIYGDGGNVRDWLHVEDHCAGILLVLAQGRARREVQHRRRQRAHQPRDRRSHLRRGRGAAPRRVEPGAEGQGLPRSEDVRAGSAGPRSPLRDRRDQDPPRARLGAAPRVRRRAGRDRALVSRAPRLVRAGPSRPLRPGAAWKQSKVSAV